MGLQVDTAHTLQGPFIKRLTLAVCVSERHTSIVSRLATSGSAVKGMVKKEEVDMILAVIKVASAVEIDTSFGD